MLRRPIGPVRPRETACEGYRRALAAHQEVAPPRRVDPGIAAAVERQTAAMRELSRRAFPETDVAVDEAPTPFDANRSERRRQAEVTRAAALRRARAEKAGRPMTTPQALENTARPAELQRALKRAAATPPAFHP
ncbi:hypothetical protein [Streptomyces griseus]